MSQIEGKTLDVAIVRKGDGLIIEVGGRKVTLSELEKELLALKPSIVRASVEGDPNLESFLITVYETGAAPVFRIRRDRK